MVTYFLSTTLKVVERKLNIKFKMTKFSLKKTAVYIFVAMVSLSGCADKDGKTKDITLITLDPGHFHAALIQKSMFNGVNDSVYVYAPEGKEVDAYLALVDKYNTRADDPTSWKEAVYLGNDYLAKMLEEKKGNVLILAGNNQRKTDYIYQAVDAGINVLADKPMAIDAAGFKVLESSFKIAAEKKVLLYDIMTERYEITNILQKEIAETEAIFGELEKGTADNPAIRKESVHHFFKMVSGAPLVRPAWYYDVDQEGNGLVDVTTHLVDLIQWSTFNKQVLNYKTDVKMLSAKRWATSIDAKQFEKSTGLSSFPDYLKKDMKGDLLNVFSNGEMNYTLKGIHARVSVIWNFQAPEGTGDTHFSVMRGTKAYLIIRQGAEQNYKPILYLEAVNPSPEFSKTVEESFKNIQQKHSGVSLKKVSDGWEIEIPEKYHVGHEAHFSEVATKYFSYLKEGKLPDWEVAYMLTKYYTTTSAIDLAKKSQ